jgi:hypothetical protein
MQCDRQCLMRACLSISTIVGRTLFSLMISALPPSQTPEIVFDLLAASFFPELASEPTAGVIGLETPNAEPSLAGVGRATAKFMIRFERTKVVVSADLVVAMVDALSKDKHTIRRALLRRWHTLEKIKRRCTGARPSGSLPQNGYFELLQILVPRSSATAFVTAAIDRRGDFHSRELDVIEAEISAG